MRVYCFEINARSVSMRCCVSSSNRDFAQWDCFVELGFGKMGIEMGNGFYEIFYFHRCFSPPDNVSDTSWIEVKYTT